MSMFLYWSIPLCYLQYSMFKLQHIHNFRFILFIYLCQDKCKNLHLRVHLLSNNSIPKVFWDLIECRLVISYCCYSIACQSDLRCDQYIILKCHIQLITSQKSEDLCLTMAEARNLMTLFLNHQNTVLIICTNDFNIPYPGILPIKSSYAFHTIYGISRFLNIINLLVFLMLILSVKVGTYFMLSSR